MRNRHALPTLDADAVVEVPCAVDGNAAGPAVEAAITGRRRTALGALALHPLADSINVARRLLDADIEELAQLTCLHGS
jgi:6-phospho-beta-glucosidase